MILLSTTFFFFFGESFNFDDFKLIYEKKKKISHDNLAPPEKKKNFGSATASILCLFSYLITRKYDNLQAFKKKKLLITCIFILYEIKTNQLIIQAYGQENPRIKIN